MPDRVDGATKSPTSEPATPGRLESWKEIAVYLKRDVRTVQRWEKTAGMPVHRHASEKVGAVYAHQTELDAWFKSRRPRLEQQKTRAARHDHKWWVGAFASISVAAGMVLWLRHPAPPSSGMVARQVWAGTGVDNLGAPFPNGHRLSFVDWETGDLAVRDLDSSSSRRLTNKGSWAESQDFAERSIVSPDGRQIAYAWFNKGSYDLRLIAAGGGQPRVLFRREDLFWIRPAAWSADGEQILAVFSSRKPAAEMVMVSVTDGSLRVLKSLDWRNPAKISLSPDGRYVVYDAPSQKDSTERDIWALSTATLAEEVVVRHPADDYAPVWSPDGKKVLFASERTGTTGIWGITVADGKAQGAAELVKSNVGRIFPLGFTREGSYYYSLNTGMQDIYVAEIDPATGKLVASPERATERFLGSNLAPTWSPDGQQLAYLSQRGASSQHVGGLTVVIRSLSSGEERDLPVRLNLSPPIGWFPDCRSLLVSARDQGRWSFYRVDAQSGAARLIHQSTRLGGGIPSHALSPDGKTIIFSRRDLERKRGSILAVEIERGDEKELHEVVQGVSSLTLSNDGRQLAFSVAGSGVYLIPARGGEARHIFRSPGIRGPGGLLAWTRDGRYLLTVRRSGSSGENAELWRVPVAGGEPQKIELPGKGVVNPSVHPDGRRMAYTGGRAGQGEIWVLSNFLDH